ncbi:MAG: glycosyltransferase family 39 protein, partial [Armatimonadia bacterium]
MTKSAPRCHTATRGDQPSTTAPGFLTRWGWLAVLLVGLAMYFVGIWSYHFLDPDEGRYAEIPREMLESGDFVTPRLNYVKYFEKPPLMYWITAGAFALAGEKEWAGRAVPATAGFLTLLLVMGLGRRMWGKRGGVISGWVYLTSVLPLVMARLLIIDGLFGLCLSACWASWWLGTDTEEAVPKRRWYLAAWACLALATLAKGPTAIAMSAGVVLVYCGLRRDFRPLREMAWAPGLLLFAVIALPWHVLVSLANPEFPYYYIVVQHLLRAAGQEHIKPAWYFFVITPLGMWGWALIALPVFWAALRKSLALWRRPVTTAAQDADTPRTDREHSAVTFLVVWALGVVVFFSLSRCKLVPYMQPAYPALALLIGWYLTRGVRAVTAVRVAAAVTGLLFLCLGIAAPFLAAEQDVVPAASFMPLAYGLAAGMVISALALFVSSFRGRWLTFTPGLVLALIVPFLVANIPLFAQYKRVGAILDGMPQPMPAD